MSEYQLHGVLRALHVNEHNGTIIELPAGSAITVCGDAAFPRLVEICCAGEHYAVFHEDLVYRADRITVKKPLSPHRDHSGPKRLIKGMSIDGVFTSRHNRHNNSRSRLRSAGCPEHWQPFTISSRRTCWR